MIVLTTCPECAGPAELLDTFTLASTDGPLPHAKLVCRDGHVRTVLAERLPGRARVHAALPGRVHRT